MGESAHYYPSAPKAVYGVCGECPLSSVHIGSPRVGTVKRSGSGVTGEEILVYAVHTLSIVYIVLDVLVMLLLLALSQRAFLIMHEHMDS